MVDEEPLSVKVIRAVAQKEGIVPVDLAIPLHDAVNPDALDQLFRSNDATLTFEYYGYEICVSKTGIVRID